MVIETFQSSFTKHLCIFNRIYRPFGLVSVYNLKIITTKYICRKRGRPKGSTKKATDSLVQSGGVAKKPRDSIGLRSKAAKQSASSARKAAWKQWLENYISETEAMVRRCRNMFVKCPECREDIIKAFGNFENAKAEIRIRGIKDHTKYYNGAIL